MVCPIRKINPLPRPVFLLLEESISITPPPHSPFLRELDFPTLALPALNKATP